MVTGSHNPPNYNGIKMMIGGITQAGDQITGMYDRIKSGNLRVGKGNVSQVQILDRFRERISGRFPGDSAMTVIFTRSISTCLKYAACAFMNGSMTAANPPFPAGFRRRVKSFACRPWVKSSP